MKSSLLDNLEHFFTTRESIIKTKEDNINELVKQNRAVFCKYFGVEKIISPSQTHSSNVDVFNALKADYPETDGLVINQKGAIALNFADCTPLIFFDGKTAAVSHAGWRGTAGKIAQKTVLKMKDEFNSDIKKIKCAIGPAISFCCFNIKEDVLNQLISTVKTPDGLYEIRNGEIYADLKGINRQQLIEIGLAPENIDVCPYCTVCDNNLFFSYRKEQGTTNRHSAVVCIR